MTLIKKIEAVNNPIFCPPKKQSRSNQSQEKMSALSKLSAEERYARELNREKVLEQKLTTPLTAETDALKLKELTKRFPFADFHVTDHKLGLYYRVAFNHASVDWMPEMLWYKDQDQVSWLDREYDNGTPFFYFPRPCKIEITTGGFKKDITHLFN